MLSNFFGVFDHSICALELTWNYAPTFLLAYPERDECLSSSKVLFLYIPNHTSVSRGKSRQTVIFAILAANTCCSTHHIWVSKDIEMDTGESAFR